MSLAGRGAHEICPCPNRPKVAHFGDRNDEPDSQAKEGGRLEASARGAMKRNRLCVVMLLLTACVGWRAGAQESLPLSAEEKELLELTNRQRTKKDLPPLRPSPRLFQVARAHAANMAKQDKLLHTLDGRTTTDRLRAAEYRFASGGESIAKSEATVTLPAFLKAWMQKEEYRHNILLPEFTETGLGMARDSGGQVYYVQVFARPQGNE
jgi:uncharacterized protein YkwD